MVGIISNLMKNLNLNMILMYYKKVQENLTRYDHFCEYYEFNLL
jgi:hypothetical protein